LLVLWQSQAKKFQAGEPHVAAFEWKSQKELILEIHGTRIGVQMLGTICKTVIKEIIRELDVLTFGIILSGKEWRGLYSREEKNNEDTNFSPIPSSSDTLLRAIQADPELNGITYQLLSVGVD
jgi:hypothetical protein